MKNLEAKQEETARVLEEVDATQDADALHEFSNIREKVVQSHIIKNEHASAKTLDKVARKAPDFDNKFFLVANHKNTSPETLDWVYKRSQGKGLIHAISRWMNPVTASYEAEIRKALAKNKNTPLSVIKKLLNDDDESVRLALAENPTLSNSVIGDLSHDSSPLVRLALGQNANIPRKTRIEILTNLLNVDDYGIKLEVLKNDELPESVRDVNLTELCFDKHKKVWQDLAGLPNLNLDAVQSLVRNGDIEVKRELVANHSLPFAAYSLLASEDDFHLLELLGDNPAVPHEILEDMAKVSIEALKEMERLKQYTLVAVAVATNPSTPQSALEAFASMHPASQTDGALPGVDAGEEEEMMDKSIPAQLRYLALHNPNYKK